MEEVEVGVVRDFFAHPVVAAVELLGDVRIGDVLHFRGHTTDLEMRLESMQIEHRDVLSAGVGEDVGMKVPTRVRPGDRVYRLAPGSA
ncbi:MAG: translation elongation factor-like protein [Chloroflexi bacterium]|nr:translation elongation factor-like protein [Chloroflexota bacterium]